MKKLILSLMLLMGAMSSFAYDAATSGTVYYGSNCAAYGLADGTVAIYQYYTSDDQTEVVFPSSIQIWTTEEPFEITAEYEVSAVGVSGWGSIYLGSSSTYQYNGSVTSLVFSEGIKTINTSAFYEMTSLSSITLPSTLTTIGDYAFTSCDNLKTITCKATSLSLGTDALKGLSSWDYIAANCVITVPDGCTANYAAYTFDNTQTWTYWDQFYSNNNIHESSSFTIGTEGYATYFNTYGYTLPEGVEGYIVNWTYDGKANIEKIYEAGDAVCDNIALLLKSTTDLEETTTFDIEVLSSYGNTATWPVDGEGNYYPNLLSGTQTEQDITAWEGDYYYYKLANGDKGLGWYWGAEDGGVFTNAAHKAYLAVAKDAGANSFISLFDELNVISQTITTSDNCDAVYTISGVRVNPNNLHRGIYIRNGKKILIH